MHRASLICVLLAGLTLLTYARALRNDFVNYDDPEYVYENDMVRRGLTGEGTRWAFQSVGYASNWHPLTWLSHMLDSQLFGPRAAMHHLVSVIIHAASVVLLFLALQRMSGCDWQSAFVAGVFALHALHVQSVAWIAERKDVLAAFFWMLTMALYARYAQRATAVGYCAVAISLALGLLCKPTLVTLPCVLLLLEFWPLQSFRVAMARAAAPPLAPSRSTRTLIIEKLPLLALCAAASILTVVAQKKAGAVLSGSTLPLLDRAQNAAVSYGRYLWKFIWPAQLSVFYPYEKWSPPVVWGATILLLALTLICVAMYRRAPYLTTGWLWFVGTLVPVIGLVQIGRQSMADRYMHIPMIGLAIIIAWGGADLLRAAGLTKRAILSLGALALVACAWRTVVEIGYWRDSETLFRRALAVTGDDNPLAHNNLGTALAMRGAYSEAAAQFEHAVRLAPNDAGAQRNLARTLAELGDTDGAIGHLRESVRLSESAFDENLLGRMLRSRGRLSEALDHLARAAQLEPMNAKYAADLAAARGGQ